MINGLALNHKTRKRSPVSLSYDYSDSELPFLLSSGESKPEVHPWPSCFLAFGKQQFLSQHELLNHPTVQIYIQ